MDIKRTARTTLNTLAVGSLIAGYTTQALAAKLLFSDEKKRRQIFTKNIGRYSRVALKKMGYTIETVGHSPELFKNKNYLIICNHMSYLDILCLSAVHPAMYITSVDMGEVFFLGTMAELGGSLFVERRHRGQIEHDIKNITTALREGFDVVLFPEGTSTNGEKILPFKKSLFMAAVEAGVDILPVVIHYKEINGKPFSAENCDKVCWHGDMSFAPHFLDAASLESAKVEIKFLEPIKVTPQSTRQELAEKAREAIVANYPGYADKSV